MLPARPPALAPAAGRGGARVAGVTTVPANSNASSNNPKRKKKRVLRLGEAVGSDDDDGSRGNSPLRGRGASSPPLARGNDSRHVGERVGLHGATRKRALVEEVLTPSNVADATTLEHLSPEGLEVFGHRLRRFFSYYEPSQLAVLDDWLANWRGREGELLRELIWFHGPEPPMQVPLEAIEVDGERAHSAVAAALARTRGLLVNFLSFYAPQSLGRVDGIMAAWRGQEDVLLERLSRQARVRDAVLQYYASAWPDRAHESVLIAQEWLGIEGELLKALPRIPVGPAPYVVNPDKPALRTRRALSARQQVKQFFRVYKPEHLGELDAVMEAFEGREDWLLMTLRRQYLGDADVTTLLDHSFLRPEIKAAFRTLCAHWNPSACDELEELFWQFRGTEEEFVLHMCSLGRGAETDLSSEATAPNPSAMTAPSAMPPVGLAEGPSPLSAPLVVERRSPNRAKHRGLPAVFAPGSEAPALPSSVDDHQGVPAGEVKASARKRRDSFGAGEGASALDASGIPPDARREGATPTTRQAALGGDLLDGDSTFREGAAGVVLSAPAASKRTHRPLPSAAAPAAHAQLLDDAPRSAAVVNSRPPPRNGRGAAAEEEKEPHEGSAVESDRPRRSATRKRVTIIEGGIGGGGEAPPQHPPAGGADPAASGGEMAAYEAYLAAWSAERQAHERRMGNINASSRSVLVPNPSDIFKRRGQEGAAPEEGSSLLPPPGTRPDDAELVNTPRSGGRTSQEVGGSQWGLSAALEAVGSSALYSLCLREDIDLALLCTLSADDLRGLGVADPHLLRTPLRLAALNGAA